MEEARCEFCQVSYDSVSAMCDHVMGLKHREVLESVLPDDVKQLGRLQYLVDTHLRSFCILGLQYLMEIQRGSSYLYCCTLCNVDLNLREMAIHISDLEHTERYIHTHHDEEFRDLNDAPWDQRASLLTLTAQRIHSLYGSGKICSIEYRKLSDKICSLCDVCSHSCTSLCDHVQGKLHKKNLLSHAPEQLKELGSLVHFMKHHMEEEFPLGLEYIVEIKEGSSYNFTCQLCGFNAKLCAIVKHIMEAYHMERYVKKHHSDMLASLPKCSNKFVYGKALQDVAVKIILKYGRKEIQLKNSAVFDPTKVEPFLKEDSKTSKACEDNECDALSSKHKTGNGSHSKRRPLPYPEAGSDESHESYSCEKMAKKSDIDGPPLAKRGILFFEGDEDASPSRPHTSKYRGSHYNERQLQNTDMELDYAVVPDLDFTAVQELEFRTNKQFLEYLAKFSIDNDEDATFIQEITKNCFKALTNFQEEEAKMQNSISRPEAPLAHTSKTGQEAPDISARKTAPDISAKKTASDISAKKSTLNISAKQISPASSATKTAPVMSVTKTSQDISVKRTSPDSSRKGTSSDIYANKTESHSSGSETSLLKDTSNPSSDPISKNEITNYFFSSIKNMDESQVIGIFHKIAATHPEFQGMDIPAVMRFLKDSGRLNAS